MGLHPNFRWWALAACKDHETDLFFRHDDWSHIEARMVCDHCPTKPACLHSSLEEALSLPAGHDFGIRAGLDPIERAELIQLIVELDRTGTVVQIQEDHTA